MLRFRKGRELAVTMPLDRLLTETDAPFARDGDQPLMPWQAYDCLAKLSAMNGVDAPALARQIRENLKALPVDLQARMS